jgi:hypothetical protein
MKSIVILCGAVSPQNMTAPPDTLPVVDGTYTSILHVVITSMCVINRGLINTFPTLTALFMIFKFLRALFMMEYLEVAILIGILLLCVYVVLKTVDWDTDKGRRLWDHICSVPFSVDEVLPSY